LSLLLAPHAPADAPDDLWRYDTSRVERVRRFSAEVCKHTKGRYAGTPFVLSDWQLNEIVAPIFGTVRYDAQHSEWVRQYRLAWIEIARKNGKSELLSMLALLGLCADDEESAEVYSVAVDRDQASLVFDVARRMVELSPILSKRLVVVESRKRIIDPKTNSVYQVLPGDAGGALGTNPSMVLFDEVLTQKDRHLWDAMRQGFGTRRQPILIAATTAAYKSAKFALEEHEYGESLLRNPEMDPSRYVFIRGVPEDADWTDEGEPARYDESGRCVRQATGWYWSNPALGDFLRIDDLRAEATEAKIKPRAQNAFRVFRLNQWVSQASRWLDMSEWDANGTVEVTREQLKGRPCVGGLDLASNFDFTAWLLVFPGSPDDASAPGFTVLPHFWLPRSAVEKRAPMQTALETWEREGLLTVTETATTDYAAMRAHIEQDAADFEIRAFGYDPWNAGETVTYLEDHGLTAIKVPQTAPRLNDPCKVLENAIANRQAFHGGHPILRWQADNVEAEATPDGLIKPSKAKSGDKIDGIAALINALFVALVPVEDDPDVTFISFSDDESDEAQDEDGDDELDALLREWRESDFDADFDD
jgi:phage terminase large subunit-like protein